MLSKRTAGVLIGLAALVLAFLAGRWSAALQGSLQQETNYPWDLHRKISQAGIGCDVLTANPSAGRFHVRLLHDGATLIVVSHGRQTGNVSGAAIDTSGRTASDSWVAECPR